MPSSCWSSFEASLKVLTPCFGGQVEIGESTQDVPLNMCTVSLCWLVGDLISFKFHRDGWAPFCIFEQVCFFLVGGSSTPEAS